MKLSRWYRLITVLFIVEFSIWIRFYNFYDQWDLFGDAGRDQIVGWGAYLLHDMPYVGSFSSSGPFVFGPIYYWLISLSFWVFPHIPVSPQVFFRLVMLFPIVFLYRIGYALGKSRLALITALLAATSPTMVERATSMTHHGLITVTASAMVWLFVLYVQTIYSPLNPSLKRKKLLLTFALGLVMGIGVNIHYQMLNLWPIFAVILLINRLKVWVIWQELVLMAIGFSLPNLPFFYWDAIVNNWANMRNFFDYIFIVQERRYVPNRWLTYLFNFWPNLWLSMVGGIGYFGYFILLVFGLVFVWQLLKRRFTPPLFWLGIVAILMMIVLRYYRGEIFFGYFIFFFPFIIIFSAWVINELFVFNKALAIVLLVGILVAHANDAIRILTADTRMKFSQQIEQAVSVLSNDFPQMKFTPYVYGEGPEDKSYGLVIWLAKSDLLGENGMPIGLCKVDCPGSNQSLMRVFYNPDDIEIIDLSSMDIAAVNKANALKNPPSSQWKKFTAVAIYDDVALWWKTKPLTSPFSLKNYILERVGLR